MKKFAVILFALLYTAITSGFTVNLHYCMGKLAGVRLHGAATDACSKCGKAAKGGDCCRDEVKYCKVGEWHQGVQLQQVALPAEKALHMATAVVPVPALTPLHTFHAYNTHAPPGTAIPLYLHYCTFLI